MDWLPSIFVVCLLIVLMLAWVLGKTYQLHAQLEPIVNSALVRTVAGVGR